MADVSEFLNTKQAGQFISRSPAAIRNLVLRRKIPFRKPGGRLMFVRTELVQWIEQAPGLSIKEFKKRENHGSYGGGYDE